VKKWYQDIKRASIEAIMVVVGMKSDLVMPDSTPVDVQDDEVEDFIAHNEIAFHIKTSAKTGMNVKELFEQLAVL
jgi:predicted GTPase